MFNYGDFYRTFESVDRILRLRRNGMYIMRKRRPSQYQENYLLHFNSILINYKLLLEELDVLGEEYERPARSKWYRQF